MAENTDGEYFTDVPRTSIPNADTWDTLSANQLIETKNTLMSQLFAFQNRPEIAKTLQKGIARLDALISLRSVGS